MIGRRDFLLRLLLSMLVVVVLLLLLPFLVILLGVLVKMLLLPGFLCTSCSCLKNTTFLPSCLPSCF